MIDDSILPDELQLTEENEDFAQVPLHKKIPLHSPSLDDKTELDTSDEWQADPLNRLRQPNAETPAPVKDVGNVLAEEDLMRAKRKITDSFEEIIFSDEEIDGTGLDPSKPTMPPQSVPKGSGLRPLNPEMTVPTLANIPFDAKTQEKIFREEVRVIAEKICWSLLPDITERVVREEIKKLLQEQ